MARTTSAPKECPTAVAPLVPSRCRTPDMARACAAASSVGRGAGAAVAEQVDADHPVLGGEFGGHPVEPVHRAGEAVHEDHGRSVLGSVLAHVHVVAVDADEVPDPSSLGARWVRHGGYDDARRGIGCFLAGGRLKAVACPAQGRPRSGRPGLRQAGWGCTACRSSSMPGTTRPPTGRCCRFGWSRYPATWWWSRDSYPRRSSRDSGSWAGSAVVHSGVETGAALVGPESFGAQCHLALSCSPSAMSWNRGEHILDTPTVWRMVADRNQQPRRP